MYTFMHGNTNFASLMWTWQYNWIVIHSLVRCCLDGGAIKLILLKGYPLLVRFFVYFSKKVAVHFALPRFAQNCVNAIGILVYHRRDTHEILIRLIILITSEILCILFPRNNEIERYRSGDDWLGMVWKGSAHRPDELSCLCKSYSVARRNFVEIVHGKKRANFDNTCTFKSYNFFFPNGDHRRIRGGGGAGRGLHALLEFFKMAIFGQKYT